MWLKVVLEMYLSDAMNIHCVALESITIYPASLH